MTTETGVRATNPATRIPEVDWLKGVAILWVLIIHAKALDGTFAGTYLINRAVPIFVILFGLTSDQWWSKRSTGDTFSQAIFWYRTRLLRLMIPVWSTLAVWWPMQLVVNPLVPAAPKFIAATALGYVPWVGTGWFVTLVLQLVLLFPLIRLAVDRLGIALPFLAGLAILVASYVWMFHVIALLEWLLRNSASKSFWYFWVFSPIRIFAVVAGIAIARRLGRPGQVHAAIALSCVIAAILVHSRLVGHARIGEALLLLIDIPLTIVLLFAMSGLRWVPQLAEALAWCGQHSWGLYLGQLLTHTYVYALGLHPWVLSSRARWAYVGLLLAGAISFVLVGNNALELARGLRRRSGGEPAA
jgi:peptidoglycan/LPS O-acetylase OafA/YrhL